LQNRLAPCSPPGSMGFNTGRPQSGISNVPPVVYLNRLSARGTQRDETLELPEDFFVSSSERSPLALAWGESSSKMTALPAPRGPAVTSNGSRVILVTRLRRRGSCRHFIRRLGRRVSPEADHEELVLCRKHQARRLTVS
jgi:hypothetical protein